MGERREILVVEISVVLPASNKPEGDIDSARFIIEKLRECDPGAEILVHEVRWSKAKP